MVGFFIRIWICPKIRRIASLSKNTSREFLSSCITVVSVLLTSASLVSSVSWGSSSNLTLRGDLGDFATGRGDPLDIVDLVSSSILKEKHDFINVNKLNFTYFRLKDEGKMYYIHNSEKHYSIIKLARKELEIYSKQFGPGQFYYIMCFSMLFHMCFLLFLASAGGSNPARSNLNLAGQYLTNS